VFNVGDTIELVEMPDDPCAIPVGTKGTVSFVNEVKCVKPHFTQIGVNWANGRTLSLVMPPDKAKRVIS